MSSLPLASLCAAAAAADITWSQKKNAATKQPCVRQVDSTPGVYKNLAHRQIIIAALAGMAPTVAHKKKTKVKKHDKNKGKKRPVPRKTKKRAPKTPDEKTFIYILQSDTNSKKSYVGVTNDLARRLRQHNGQLVGGARFTRGNRPWVFCAIFVVSNRHDALSIEWKIKHGKRRSDGVGIAGKIAAACRFGAMVAKFSQLCGPAPACRAGDLCA